jgi:hypothetical protein
MVSLARGKTARGIVFSTWPLQRPVAVDCVQNPLRPTMSADEAYAGAGAAIDAAEDASVAMDADSYDIPKELYPKKDWCLDDFELGRPLGKGQFGTTPLPAAAASCCPAWLAAASRLLTQLAPMQQQHVVPRGWRAGNVYLAREKRTKFIVALKVRPPCLRQLAASALL